jgi:FkbM family methyltransferase
MKSREINENPAWTYILPDSIADWDAPSHWERERLASMQAHLKPGMVLYDVGTEHGWLSAVYGAFTGHGNMVLIEPSPEMWVNIRKTWDANGFDDPIASFQAFCGERPTSRTAPASTPWPDCSVGYVEADECPAMAYRYIGDDEIPVTTIDQIVTFTKRPPDAITVDVEGFEIAVMRGAEMTLLKHRPLVWISVHEDLMERAGWPDVQELYDFMTGMGYGREFLGRDHEAHNFFAPLEWSPPS